ncbi:MAG: thioredoxin-dependent thiol peroxidase [Erysipelotrichaceae bacterium]
MLEIGQEAPLFELPNQQGEVRKLKDYQGQYVVLYFYPKDNTPGCTVQACNYRDTMPEFTKRNIKVFGISKDGGDSHRKFESDFDLNFELLSDEDHAIIEAYGVWGEKMNYGKPYMGVLRTTFVVDPNGKVVKIFPKVDPKLDPQQVLEFIDQH